MKGTTKSNGQKDIFDRFYTKPEVALELLQHIDLEGYDVVIEPSAGAGAFSKNIKDCIAYDIVPNCEGVQQGDWFEVDKNLFKGRTLIVGNPPFGQQNSIAVKFFNESAFADTIAFIVPKSFKKDSVKNRLCLDFHLIKEIEINDNSFLLNGEEASVPCVFQIWSKNDEPRSRVRLRTTTNLFNFTTKDKADFRIQRVGGNAGKSFFDLDKSEQSNYFIENTSSMSNEDFVSLVNSLTFPSIEFTVGPKSLSKGELIAIIEEELDV